MKLLTVSALLAGLVLPAYQWGLCSSVVGTSLPPELQAIDAKLSKTDPDQRDVDRLGSFIASHPDNARAHFLAGKVYEHSGLTGLAEEEFEKADKLSPDLAESVLETFTHDLDDNDFAAAQQDFSYLSGRFENEPAVLLMWVRIYNRKKQPEVAEDYFKLAMTVAPIRVGVAAAAGSIRLDQHRYQEALTLAKQDLARQPDHYLANAVAGQACFRLGKNEQGAGYLRKAFTQQPLLKNNDYAFADSFYRARLYRDALTPALVHMAMCTEVGDLQAAKKQLRAIVQQLPRSACENVAARADDLLKKTPFRSRMHSALWQVYDQLTKSK
jgi:tetratricopeptide (TPR) repeat protein